MSALPSSPIALSQVFVPFALGHFISYLFRTINAVISPDLARDLGLDATDLGLLTGVYFLTFAAAQLPIGVALDRFGPRRVQIPLLATAAVGAALFSQSTDLVTVAIGRALIGAGVAGCLMSAIKALTMWLPPGRLPFSTGLLLAVGGVGAMASTMPLEALLHITDWRGIFLGLAVATGLLSLVFIVLVPDRKPTTKPAAFRDQIAAIGQLYSSWSFWRLALFSLLAHATYMAVQGLWMGLWLRDVVGLDRAAVGMVLFAGTAAMVAGSIALGWCASQTERSGFKPILVCGVGVGIFIMVQAVMAAGYTNAALPLAILFGFFGTAATLNYAIVAQSVPTHLTGRVSTCFNLLVFLLAFVVQWGIGAVINLWPVDAAGHYPAEAYSWSLGGIMLLQLPGLLLWVSFRPWQRTVAPPDSKAEAAA